VSSLSSALTEQEREELRAVLSGSLFRRAAARIVQEAEGKRKVLLTMNFSIPDAVNKAVRLQGEIAGILRVLDGLIDLTEEKEVDNA
jgi:hypothetical protein